MVPESGSIDPHLAATNVPSMYGQLSAPRLSNVKASTSELLFP